MAKICGKYVLHCNGIDPFVTLMGNFNWGPISRNDIVSTYGTCEYATHRSAQLCLTE